MKRLRGLGPAGRALAAVLTGPEPPPAWKWRSPAERRTARSVLGAVTLALLFVSATHVGRDGGSSATAGQLVLAVAVVLPLPVAARSPLLAWRLGWFALLLAPLLPAVWWGGWPWGPAQLVAQLIVFCLAALRQPRAGLWWMWALTLIPWCGWLIADVPDLNGPASATIVLTVAVQAAGSAGSSLRAQTALSAQTALASAERARRAVLEERTRIARELHDVVAHHLSLIAVQAETAPYRMSELPEPVRAELASLSEVAREALTEMRRLLGVLRQEETAELAPQPRLTDLPALVDNARRAGVDIELSLRDPLPVPAGVGVCVYRIVQESLSNATRHAPGAAVAVSLDQVARAVRLRVVNGPGTSPREQTGDRPAGHGLTGMRERVTLLGGTLSAGPTPGGGFTVAVTLPLGETA